jgi:hypothetical protein
MLPVFEDLALPFPHFHGSLCLTIRYDPNQYSWVVEYFLAYKKKTRQMREKSAVYCGHNGKVDKSPLMLAQLQGSYVSSTSQRR